MSWPKLMRLQTVDLWSDNPLKLQESCKRIKYDIEKLKREEARLKRRFKEIQDQFHILANDLAVAEASLYAPKG